MDGLFEFAELIGVQRPAKPRWDIPVGAADIAAIAPLFAKGTRTLVISPCTGQRFRNYRNWRADWYAEIADYAAHALRRPRARDGRQHGHRAELRPRHRGRGPFSGPEPDRQDDAEATARDSRSARASCSAPTPARPTWRRPSARPVVGLYATSNRHRTGPYFSQHLVVDKYPEAVAREFGRPDRDAALGPAGPRPGRDEPDYGGRRRRLN